MIIETMDEWNQLTYGCCNCVMPTFGITLEHKYATGGLNVIIFGGDHFSDGAGNRFLTEYFTYEGCDFTKTEFLDNHYKGQLPDGTILYHGGGETYEGEYTGACGEFTIEQSNGISWADWITATGERLDENFTTLLSSDWSFGLTDAETDHPLEYTTDFQSYHHSRTYIKYRWQIPNTYTGVYFKITWDVLTEPEDELISPSLEEDFVYTWTGPLGDPENPNDPAWFSPDFYLQPPTVPGNVRIVNIRYQEYKSGRIGIKPQVFGEFYSLSA